MDVPFPRGKTDTDEKSAKRAKRPDSTTEDELFKVKRFRKVEPAKPVKAPGAKRKREAEKSNLLATPLPEIGLGMTKSVANNKVIKIDTINFGNYVTGSQALGYILQVHDDAVVVSLPGGVSGTVQLSEISDVHNKVSRQQLDKATKASVGELSDILSVMQPVRCYVLNTTVESGQKKTTGRKTLNLSIRPSYVNRGLMAAHMVPGFPISGTVSSVEDRMYIVSTGVSGFTFILPFSAVPTAISPLRLGQPIDSLVDSINNPAKTVTLRAQRKSVATAVVAGVKLTFNSLSPGMLVNVIVDKIVDNGLIVGFFGLFFGTIDNYNLSRLYNGKDEEWKSHFEEGGVTQARIVYVDHANKSVRLSLRPHVLEFRAPKYLPALGDTLKDYKVGAIVKRTGLYITNSTEESPDDSSVGLTIKKGSKKAQAAAIQKQREADEAAIRGVFVHKSSLADASGKGSGGQGKDAADWESRYKLGKAMDVRVSGYHLVEGIAIASNVDAFMTGSVVHSSQVEVGQVLEVEVIKVADFGLVVKLGGKVRAICPVMHLSDTAGTVKTATQIKKYKVGQKHTMRVWEVKGAQIVMTNKKSIVQAPVALSSYSQAEEGTIAQGIVSKVSQSGLQIHFFNKVKGEIPSSILVKQGVTDIDLNYRIGQVVKCFVLQRITPKETSRKINSTLILGLNLGNVADLMNSTSAGDPEEAEAPDTPIPAPVTNAVLDVVTGTVIKSESDVVHVRLESGELALLHKDHLCDIASHGADVFSKIDDFFPAGTSLTGVHLGANKNGSVNISIKPLFLAVAGVKASDSAFIHTTASQQMTIPNRVGDLSAGQLVAGSVWKVESYGILVRFRDGMTALAPRPNVADTFISSPVGLFRTGDSVRCMVQRVDLTRERAMVTLKPSVVPPSAGNMLYVSALLQEKFLLAKKTSTLDWRSNCIGQVVKATVTAVKSYGVVLMGTDNVTMMLAKSTEGEVLNYVEGDSVEALVLDIDFENSVLDVTLDADMVPTVKKVQVSGKKKSKKIADAECAVGEICHNSVIALIKSQYLVVVVKGIVCFVMIADYNCPYKTTTDYKLLQTVSIKVERCLPKSFVSHLSDSTARDSPYSLSTMGSVFVEDSDSQRKQPSSSAEQDTEEPTVDSLTATEHQSGKTFVESLRIGAMLRWEVVEVSNTIVTVVPENHADVDADITASIHVSSAVDSCDGCDDLESILDKIAQDDVSGRGGISVHHPFHSISKGAKVSARVIQVRHAPKDSDKGTVVYLSLPPHHSKKGKKNASNQWKRMLQWSGRESIKMDTLYAGAITAVHKSHCTVALSPYISANMSILDISKDVSLIEKFRDYCYVGMKVMCTVTELSISRQKSSISISRALVEDIASGSVLVDLTKTVTVNVAKPPSEQQATPGQVLLGVVDMGAHSHPKKPPALTVLLSNGKRGRVCVTEVSDAGSWKDYAEMFAAHAASQKRCRSGSNVSVLSTDSSIAQEADFCCDIFDGKVVKCCVLSTTHGLELSLRESRIHATSKAKATVADAVPTPGTVVQGYVANTSLKGCFVRLTSKITGRVLMKELSDDFVQSPVDSFPPGKLVQAKVLSVNDNSQGDSDNMAAVQVDLSLRSSAVHGDLGGKDFNSLKKGDIISGTVHRVTDFGVFVAISNTSLVGLSRKAMAAAQDEELSSLYEEGDNVRAVVISKSVGNKIALGLKASYFNGDLSDDDDENAMDIDSDESGNDKEEDVDDGEGSDEASEDGSDNDDVSDEDDEEDDNLIIGYEDVSDSEEDDDVAALLRGAAMHTGETDISDCDSDEEDADPAPAAKKAKKSVEEPESESESSDDESDIESPFMSNGNNSSAGGVMLNWGDNFKPAQAAAAPRNSDEEDSGEEESEGEESDEEAGASHAGRKKVSQRRKAEEATRKKESALLDGSAEPSSPDDFERLVITQPNSSLLWIQYMSFFMLAADIDSARRIAHRALRAINFREEDEKYNVWVALVNLEHKYGTMASLDKCFKQGVSETKGKYLHIHLAELYDSANDVKGARLLFERALKKHKTSKKVWMAYQHFELRRHNDKEARALLGRSMLSLSRHKHIEVILQYASLLFELENFDMGREVFEDLLQNYPKRTDIWNVFVDKEVKYKNFSSARRIFERMICLKISAKNVKSVFKKYLTFELSHGTVEEQNGVKQKAREYVESLM